MQGGRADDEHRGGTIAQHELLHGQARFDGLAQAHVICQQQVDARHGQSPGHRLKLVVLGFDAAAEGRLHVTVVHLRNDAPADSIQEGVQIAGIVESPYIRQGGCLADLGPWLQLPDDLQFLIKGVLVKAGERHQMLILLRGLW